MKKPGAKKKPPQKNLKPVVLVLLTLLAGGMAVRVERQGLRVELEIGKRA